MRRFALVGIAAVIAALVAVRGDSSACCDGGTSWSLAKTSYDRYGNSAVLVPGNDTRVNLLLLLADRPAGRLDLRPEDPPAHDVFFGWTDLRRQAIPPPPGTQPDYGDYVEPSRCQSAASGARAFEAAVQANRSLAADERQALILARQALRPDCADGPQRVSAPPVRGPAAMAFASYIAAAADFYGGNFPAASATFASLCGAEDPWVRETAAYMVARTELNRAVATAFDEYGYLVKSDDRDRQAAASAAKAFDAYLEAYPSGRYASSARGLLRRAYWLAGKDGALAAAFAIQARSGTLDGAASEAALVDEIDLKLFESGGANAIRDPILLAVADLQRMRRDPGSDCCVKPITRAEIDAQRPLFGNDLELYDYVRAAESFFVRGQPREVLQLIPDKAKQRQFSYLQFSRQMLRGFALEALGDRNARGFLLEMLPGATRPHQREALELAIAMHDERTARLDLVFAPASPVVNPYIREILLSHTAGPGLLRQQSRDAKASKRERESALYILLAKQLRHGFYSDFLGDVALVPAAATAEGNYYGPSDYAFIESSPEARVPLGIFTSGATAGNIGCPPLAETAAALARAPGATRPRLCLAEFMRLNGFDYFPYDDPLEGGGLAGTRPLFPGPPYSRLEVYRSIIADPSAAPDDKAYALYRAIRCYAPSGNNSCSGEEADVAQRKAWFQQLQRGFPRSRWARELKHYW